MKQAVLLIDHGSRLPEANRTLERVAEMLREKISDRIVSFAHMELASPSIAEAIGGCVEQGATEILAVPYFLTAGRHTREDIPRLLREAAAEFPGLQIKRTPPFEAEPKLVEIILDRVADASAGKTTPTR